MAADKYSLGRTLTSMAEHTAKYLLAYLKYRINISRDNEEIMAYSKLYAQVLSDPDRYQMAVTQDALEANMLRKIAAEQGIRIYTENDLSDPVYAEKYGISAGTFGMNRNIFVYEKKDYDALFHIVSEISRKMELEYDRNHFVEEKYGYFCETTGEFIPRTDQYGNSLSRDGEFIQGEFCPADQAEELRAALLGQKVLEGNVWKRDEFGNLHNEYDDVYIVVDRYGRYFDEESGLRVSTNEVFARASIDENFDMERTFHMTARGNMEDDYGHIIELPNEFGDVVHEDGSVSLNGNIEGSYRSRAHAIGGRTGEPDKTYHIDLDGNFVSEGNETVFLYDRMGGHTENGQYITHHNEQALYHIDEHGNFAGENGETIIRYNEYGDYRDNTGTLHINPDVSENLSARKSQMEDFVQSGDASAYRMTRNGNFVKDSAAPGYDGNYREEDVITAYSVDGRYVDENTGIRHVPSRLYGKDMEELTYHRVYGGYLSSQGDDFLVSFNEYGDYLDRETGEVVLNPEIQGNEEFRKERVLIQEMSRDDRG